MNTAEFRAWAVKGAEQRLVRIGEEAKAIFRYFPELRGKGRGFESAHRSDGTVTRQKAKAPRRRRKMSAAARKAVGERMKKYWAARREERPVVAARSAKPAGAAKKATRGGRRRPRKMSAEARKRISAAQKKRWAKHKAQTATAITSAGGKKK